MIAARQVLLVILFGSTSCLALKGSKRNIRSVVGREQDDDAAHRKEPSQQSVIDGIPDAQKEQNSKKEEDTTDKKQSDKKADTKHKKACKKRQQKEDKKESKEIPEEEPKEVTEVKEQREAADPVKVTEVKAEELPWCEGPSIKKLGDCAMLYSGVYPKEETIGGSLAIEITWKNDTLVQEMEHVLKEGTSMHAVGCGGRRLQENETDANNVTVYLLAVDIGSVSQSTESELTNHCFVSGKWVF
jgi:flagellar biosynthesis GTPase FlhF